MDKPTEPLFHVIYGGPQGQFEAVPASDPAAWEVSPEFITEDPKVAVRVARALQRAYRLGWVDRADTIMERLGLLDPPPNH